MLDIPQSNQDLELDCLDVEITTLKVIENLDDAINPPSIYFKWEILFCFG